MSGPIIPSFNNDDPDFHDIGDVSVSDHDDDDSTIFVTTPSKAKWPVLTKEEAKVYNSSKKAYMDELRFDNHIDIKELDRLLAQELLWYRRSYWTSLERDYNGEMIGPDVEKGIVEASKAIMEIKKNLGLDKRTRDGGNAESISELWDYLCLRAREFGILRNQQAIKAIDILKTMEAMLTAYDGSTGPERKQFGFEIEDIIEYFRSELPNFNAIDDAFREGQALWIGDFVK